MINHLKMDQRVMNNLKNGSQLRYFWAMSAMSAVVCSLLTGQVRATELTIVEQGQPGCQNDVIPFFSQAHQLPVGERQYL